MKKFKVGDIARIRVFGTQEADDDPENYWEIMELSPGGQCSIRNVKDQGRALARGQNTAHQQWHTSMLVR